MSGANQFFTVSETGLITQSNSYSPDVCIDLENIEYLSASEIEEIFSDLFSFTPQSLTQIDKDLLAIQAIVKNAPPLPEKTSSLLDLYTKLKDYFDKGGANLVIGVAEYANDDGVCPQYYCTLANAKQYPWLSAVFVLKRIIEINSDYSYVQQVNKLKRAQEAVKKAKSSLDAKAQELAGCTDATYVNTVLSPLSLKLTKAQADVSSLQAAMPSTPDIIYNDFLQNVLQQYPQFAQALQILWAAKKV